MGEEPQGCHRAGVWWAACAAVQAVQRCAALLVSMGHAYTDLHLLSGDADLHQSKYAI